MQTEIQKESHPGEEVSNKEKEESNRFIPVNYDSLMFYNVNGKPHQGNLDSFDFREIESFPEDKLAPKFQSYEQARQAFITVAKKRLLNPEPEPAKRKLKGDSILDFAIATIDNSKTLLGDRWLCRHGGALLVAPSGMGKSSWSIQAAAQWSVGREAFGISANRQKLKILIIQAEDDDGDCTEMARVINYLDLSKQEKDLLAANTRIEHVNDVSGKISSILSTEGMEGVASKDSRKSFLICVGLFGDKRLDGASVASVGSWSVVPCGQPWDRTAADFPWRSLLPEV